MGYNMFEFDKTLLKTNRGVNFYKYDSKLKDVNACIKEEFYDSFIKLYDLKGIKDESLFETKFKENIKEFPLMRIAILYLIGIGKEINDYIKGKKNFILFEKYDNEIIYNEYDFCMYNDIEDIDKYYKLFKDLNLINKLYEIDSNPFIAHIEGILMGVRNNNRKNKSGLIFESLCEEEILPLCDKYGISCYSQLQFSKLENMGVKVPKNLYSKKADFILIKENKVLNIEVNYYESGGSKRSETVESYINRSAELEKCDIKFCLITDGLGWSSTNVNSKKYSNKVKALSELKIMNYNQISKKCLLESYLKEVFL